MDPSDQLPFVADEPGADEAAPGEAGPFEATPDDATLDNATLADAVPDADAVPHAAAAPDDAAPPNAAPDETAVAGRVRGVSLSAAGEVAASATAAPPAAGAERRPSSFQASAGIQGRQFAEQCDTLLRHLGYELHGRRVLLDVGIEIDQEAVSPTGATVWFEYKGSVQGNRPGLRRTDTLKKAIANGALLRAVADPAPYVVITSHLPEAGSGAAMLSAALQLGYVADVVCLYDPKATQRLARW